MKDQIYNIEPAKLLRQVLPTFIRKPMVLAMIDAAIYPLFATCRHFASLRADAAYRLSHSGQVCYIESALNDALDAQHRRFKIQDVERKEYVLFYKAVDRKPVSFYRYTGVERATIFNKAAEIGKTSVDFKVLVPTEIYEEAKKQQIENTVNYYKLASKRYILEKA